MSWLACSPASPQQQPQNHLSAVRQSLAAIRSRSTASGSASTALTRQRSGSGAPMGSEPSTGAERLPLRLWTCSWRPPGQPPAVELAETATSGSWPFAIARRGSRSTLGSFRTATRSTGHVIATARMPNSRPRLNGTVAGMWQGQRGPVEAAKRRQSLGSRNCDGIHTTGPLPPGGRSGFCARPLPHAALLFGRQGSDGGIDRCVGISDRPLQICGVHYAIRGFRRLMAVGVGNAAGDLGTAAASFRTVWLPVPAEVVCCRLRCNGFLRTAACRNGTRFRQWSKHRGLRHPDRGSDRSERKR